MAHKKGVGSTDNGRDSKSKRLGVKLFGGQHALAGNIIVRQRGTKYHPGLNVYLGKDHTIHARIDGIVTFRKGRNDRSIVSVMPFDTVTVAAPEPTKKAPTAKPAPKPVAEPVAVETVAPASPVVEAVETAPVVEAAIEAAAVVAEAPASEAAAAVEEAAEAPAAEGAVETAAAAVEEAVEAPSEPAVKPFKTPKLDDLKVVEGIGPKIEQLFKDAGIDTWAKLAETPVARLQEILDEAGPRYQIHNPNTWPAQAKFCVEGRWEELKEYQDMLIGGRDLSE